MRRVRLTFHTTVQVHLLPIARLRISLDSILAHKLPHDLIELSAEARLFANITDPYAVIASAGHNRQHQLFLGG